MTKREKILLKASVAFAAVFAVAPASNAMHIMEGYLPAGYCVAWGVVCLPFLIAGFISLRNKVKENRRNMTLIAMAGAFIFVISSLKIPSVSGSCSHMTGTGLGAILFGPAAVSVLGIIVLIFQALLLAHGGLTTLCNVFTLQSVWIHYKENRYPLTGIAVFNAQNCGIHQSGITVLCFRNDGSESSGILSQRETVYNKIPTVWHCKSRKHFLTYQFCCLKKSSPGSVKTTSAANSGK